VRTDSKRLNFARAARLLALLLGAAAAAPMASAQDFGQLGLPLLFRVESKELVTAACLGVRGKEYRSAALPGPASKGLELAVYKVLSALQSDDKSALNGLLASDEPGGSAAGVQSQVDAYRSQFKALKPLRLTYAFEFDDVQMAWVELQPSGGGKPFAAAFAFKRRPDGQLGFLPQRPMSIPSQLIQQWYLSSVGPGQAQQAQLCSAATLNSLPYKLSLGASPSDAVSALHMQGASALTAKKPGVNEEVGALIARMTQSGQQGKFELLRPFVSEASWARMQSYRDSPDDQAFLKGLSQLSLRFVWDLGPVAVAYVQRDGGGVNSMFFSKERDGWRLVNVGLVNASTRLFERKELAMAAADEHPFAHFEKKPGL